MAFRAMLDTNVVSELMRAPRGPVAHRLEQFGADDVCISIFTSAELRYGPIKKIAQPTARSGQR